MATEQIKARNCKAIGMKVIDRDRASCVHASEWCQANCYNCKLYKQYKDMTPFDQTLRNQWSLLDSLQNLGDRFRLCSRGEPIANELDIDRIASLANNNPDTLFWVPTRSWRNVYLCNLINARLRPIGNVRVCASIDPSLIVEYQGATGCHAWSVMAVDVDNADLDALRGQVPVMCKKTWCERSERKALHGSCATCNKGCFSTDRVTVNLKKH